MNDFVDYFRLILYWRGLLIVIVLPVVLRYVLEVMIKNPVLGVGAMNLDTAEGIMFGSERPKYKAVHNVSIQIDGELSVPSLIIFLLLILKSLKDIVGNKKSSFANLIDQNGHDNGEIETPLMNWSFILRRMGGIYYLRFIPVDCPHLVIFLLLSSPLYLFEYTNQKPRIRS